MQAYPKLAILVSGQGSNLQSIIDHIESKKLRAQISVVVSNQLQAFAIQRAKKAKLPVEILSHQDFPRVQYDQALIKIFQQYAADWIVLAGFMRILGKEVVEKYSGKIINIHPSLLPKYPGMHAIEETLSNADDETGVTVHYVNEGVDTGPVILQEKIAISPQDTAESLRTKIQVVEHQIYPKALEKVLWGK